MIKGKSFLDYINLFSPFKFEKIYKIILKKIKWLYGSNEKNLQRYFCGKHRKSKNPKISYIFEKLFVLSIICSKCKNENENYLKKKIQLRC